MSFLDQIEASRKEVQRLAKTMPHIFPEWLELQAAKRNLTEAMLRVKVAQRKWDNKRKGKGHA
jgi:hypothetical protein